MSEVASLSIFQRTVKRAFDILASFVGLMLVWPFILIGWIAATISTGKNGFFVQQRIGRHGKSFPLIKLRSMKIVEDFDSTVTTDFDPRITRVGKLLRKSKLDELPQLFNVLIGQMSFVGPRPDVAGFADQLKGEDRVVLTMRPGITGPASLKFRNEESLLATQSDPETYNREVIWKEKVRLNKKYIADYSFLGDLKCILQTLTGGS